MVFEQGRVNDLQEGVQIFHALKAEANGVKEGAGEEIPQGDDDQAAFHGEHEVRRSGKRRRTTESAGDA